MHIVWSFGGVNTKRRIVFFNSTHKHSDLLIAGVFSFKVKRKGGKSRFFSPQYIYIFFFMSVMMEYKKQFSQQFSAIEVPAPLDQVGPEALASLLQQQQQHADRAVVTEIIDVRPAEEYAKGHIFSSKNIPLDEFDAERYARDAHSLVVGKKGKLKVFFVSLQSPDIDEAAALAFTRHWDELEDARLAAATSGVAVGDPTVRCPSCACLLLGGMFYWLQLHGPDPKLTSTFDSAYWEPLLRQHQGTSPAAGATR